MNLYLNILANAIIQQYFLNSRCLLIFTDDFNTFGYVGDIPVVKIDVINETIQEGLIFQYFGCQGIIIKNDKPLWTFKKFEELIRLGTERFNSRRYLILPGSNTKEKLIGIFDLEESSYVADIVIIEEETRCNQNKSQKIQLVLEEDVVYSLWTHKYTGKKYNNKKMLLDFWYSATMKFRYDNNLYPNKLTNQRQRILKLATFQYEPYSIIGSTSDNLLGSELKTALTFSKQFNMTPVLVVNPEDYWGEIYSNWSGNGLMGNLVLDKADLGFAALYTWEDSYRFLDLSKPLVRTGITCLVPTPRLAAGWLTPLYSYSSQMWIAVGILFITSIWSLFLLHCFYSKTSKNTTFEQTPPRLFGFSVFSIIKVFVLQVVTKQEIPHGFNGAYFMGLLFLFSLFLTSTYSSGLATIMTIPRYDNPINTVKEFAGSGLNWGATQDAWTTSIQNAEEPEYQEIISRFISTTEESLREYSKTGSFGFSLERLPHENFAIGSYIKEDIIGNYHLMQEDFYWEQCVFMARKNSILLPLLDSFILRVFEAGLIGYWQNEAVSLYMDTKVQQAVKFYYYHHQDHVVVKLKWSHVQGAFAALCIGYVASIIVFVLETLSSRLTKYRT